MIIINKIRWKWILFTRFPVMQGNKWFATEPPFEEVTRFYCD